MRTTSNYGLNVPELTDKPDITPISENFEKIDEIVADSGGFILMIDEIPIKQRKENTMYSKIEIDYGFSTEV